MQTEVNGENEGSGQTWVGRVAPRAPRPPTLVLAPALWSAPAERQRRRRFRAHQACTNHRAHLARAKAVSRCACHLQDTPGLPGPRVGASLMVCAGRAPAATALSCAPDVYVKDHPYKSSKTGSAWHSSWANRPSDDLYPANPVHSVASSRRAV